MNLMGLSDPAFPALASLQPADLARITDATGARLLRLRYQPGARAVLHVALGTDDQAREGAIWFFAGDKAQRLARRDAGARFDPVTQALFQAFPHDHRMPALAEFVDQAMDLAPAIIGGRAAAPPTLMRYRPGLSATFRWIGQEGRVFFVKQTPTDDVQALAAASAHLARRLDGTPLAVVPVAGILPELGVIAYHCAKGMPLDAMLAMASDADVGKIMAQVTDSLNILWSQSITPPRVMDRAEHLRRATQAAEMVARAEARAGQRAFALVARLERTPVSPRLHPIHADMKLEHAFVADGMTTLIDTESLSLGDPDDDLAKLEARLMMAELLGTLTPARVKAARSCLQAVTGPHYPWFLTCARLQGAKYFAQRMDPATLPEMTAMLAD